MPRLLLVDDNPSIHKIVTSLLAPTAIEISYAKSAFEAFGMIAKGMNFDVALIDTSLPEMDGWSLLDRLRANPKTSQWPIVMMAGVLEEVDSNRVENAPIQAFLRKPVDLGDLAKKITSILPAQTAAGEPIPQPAAPIPTPPPTPVISEEPPLKPAPLPIPDEPTTQPITPSIPKEPAPKPVALPVIDEPEPETFSIPEEPASESRALPVIDEPIPQPIASQISEEPEPKPIATDIPNDLLILEEQDLAEDIAIDTSGVITRELNFVSDALDEEPGDEIKADDTSLEEDTYDSEEVISLELEELDVKRLDQLDFDTHESEEYQPIPTPSQPIQLSPAILEPTPPERDYNLEITPKNIPAPLSETTPEDISSELISSSTGGSGNLSDQSNEISAAVSKLLTDPEFISAVARAVAKNLEKQRNV